MITAGIITCDRPYIGTSLGSFFRSWDLRPHVFQEPGTPKFLHHSRCEIHQNPKQLGCVTNWFQALSYLLQNSQTPYIMMMEDDIQWNPYASWDIRAVLEAGYVRTWDDEEIKCDDMGFLSPYCSKLNGWQAVKKGWMRPRMPANGWCGALCLILPRQSAEILIEQEEEFFRLSRLKNVMFEEALPEPRHLDMPIGKVLLDARRPLVTHKPTYIQHIGDVSTFDFNRDPNAAELESRQPAL